MDVYEPNSIELWRERLGKLLRETESYRLAYRLQATPRVVPRISGEAS